MEWSDRHTLIVDHAAQLFAAKGIAGTKVRDIADAVGILSGSLYHYFPSKDAIAETIVIRYLDDLTFAYDSVRQTQAPPAEQLSALVHASFQVSASHPHASEIYQNNADYLLKFKAYPKIKAAARSTRQVWIDVIESGVAAGEFRSDLPVEITYALIRDAVWLSLRWFKPSTGFSARDFADSITSVFLDGIRGGEGAGLSRQVPSKRLHKNTR